MAVHQEPARLVADVGGTNTRIALFEPGKSGFSALHTYTNRKYARLEDVFDAWLSSLEVARPVTCCIAVAAPTSGDRVAMVNMDWAFSRRELVRSFGFESSRWLNDFEANAYCLPHLAQHDRQLVHEGRGSSGKLATVGPGTGLGGATLEWFAGQPVATACEPGHTGLSPASSIELELFGYMHREFGEVYTELLVSGPGLPRIYRALGEIMQLQLQSEQDPAQIALRATRGEDELAVRTLQTFCALLGSACGDFVLANGAYGGLFLAGGILPTMNGFLVQSDFHARFTAKGALRAHLEKIPVYTICHPQPGLLGAAHAPL